jgi:hypothetical protein
LNSSLGGFRIVLYQKLRFESLIEILKLRPVNKRDKKSISAAIELKKRANWKDFYHFIHRREVNFTVRWSE